jgi:hypothetical protein
VRDVRATPPPAIADRLALGMSLSEVAVSLVKALARVKKQLAATDRTIKQLVERNAQLEKEAKS